MLVVRLKKEEIKCNFHVERDSLHEKVFGFWVVLLCGLPPTPNSTHARLILKSIKTMYNLFISLMTN